MAATTEQSVMTSTAVEASTANGQFCDTPFWDPMVTWWTPVPDLTPCFQFTIIRMVPCLLFWLLLPFRLYHYCQNRVQKQRGKVGVPRKCAYSTLTMTKLAVCGVVIVALLGELVQSIALNAAQVASRPTAQLLMPSIEIVTVVWVAVLIRFERRNGYKAGGTAWFFWLFEVICCAFIAYSVIFNYVRVNSTFQPLDTSASNYTNSTFLSPLQQIQNVASRWNVDVCVLILVVVRIVATLVSFGLSCVADHEVDPALISNDQIIGEFGGRPSPEMTAGFFSLLVFGWMLPVLRRGSSKALEATDLFSLNPCDRSEANAPRFELKHYETVAEWRIKQQELEQQKGSGSRKGSLKRGAQHDGKDADKRSKLEDGAENGKMEKLDTNTNPKLELVIEDDEQDAKAPLNASDSKKRYTVANGGGRKRLFAGRKKAKPKADPEANGNAKPKEKPKSAFELDKTKYPSALTSLLRVYWPELLRSHSCKLLQDVMLFTNTAVIGLLIRFADDPERYNYAWRGALYAIALCSTLLIQSVTMQHTFDLGMRCGVHMRTAVTTALYRKALTVSNAARAKATLGEIVNLMSVDAQRLQDLMGYSWAFWSCPEQIIVACVLIWFQMGVATLAGLATMILVVMPVNMVVAGRQRKLQGIQMKNKDERIKQVNELLAGIRLVKLYAWEIPFRNRIEASRNREITVLRRIAYLGVVHNFIFTFAPFLVAVVTFAVFVATSTEELTAQRAFVTLSLFQILRFPMGILPMIIQMSVTAVVAVKRISRFLAQPDLNEANVSHEPNTAEPITIDGASFGWSTGEQQAASNTSSSSDRAVLRDVTLHVRSGELLAIVGRVGAGKSTLMSAILGETELFGGRVNVSGRLAYVAQQSWIQNASLRDNVLFGAEFDEEKYKRIVTACALEADFLMLPAGDKTEIGEKGINLSGGQKQRVALARALYANADVYLLDDPLSAVDVHVGRHIFDHVIGPNGLLRDKTRVFVTHGLHWLRFCDRVAVIDPQSRSIVQTGSYDELIASPDSFFLTQLHLEDRQHEKETAEPQPATNNAEPAQAVNAGADVSSQSPKQSSADKGPKTDTESPSGAQKQSTESTDAASKAKASKPSTREEEEAAIRAAVKKQQEQKLIQEEKRETGRVKFKVYMSYFRAQSIVLFLVYAITQAFVHALFILANWWVAVWTEDPLLVAKNNAACDSSFPELSTTETPLTALSTGTPLALMNLTCTSKEERDAKRRFYLLIYALIGVAVAFAALFSVIMNAIGTVRASRVLHAGMLGRILQVPMSFFDTTPTGRILNRFSKDIDLVDGALPHTFRGWLQTMYGVVFTIIAVCIGTPLVLALIVPAGIIYYFVQRFFVPTSRQLKRLESTSKSPIFTHFSESLQGRATIRAFGARDRFVAESERRTDRNNVYCLLGLVANRWIGMYLDYISTAFVAGSAALCVIASLNDWTTGGRVGLSLTYALTVAQSLNWMVRMNSEIETNIVSVERIQEYTELQLEAAWERSEAELQQDGVTLKGDWPHQGEIKFDQYATRYRENLDLVLHDISVDLKPAVKVGIVGRTGAGKSSFTLALFRMIEAAQGRILIDGIDISHLGVHQLRSRLTILPQDPVIFAGSLRSNLDPFDTHTDDQIWHALELAGLRDHFSTREDGLRYECAEGGSNLSVGQRQLVCLARALLRKTKVLVLDEATAAVDLRTDELIQKTIRTAFADCTVITIAHRLNTVMDYDRIMVLDRGSVVEFDSPAALLARSDSIFANMVQQSNKLH